MDSDTDPLWYCRCGYAYDDDEIADLRFSMRCHRCYEELPPHLRPNRRALLAQIQREQTGKDNSIMAAYARRIIGDDEAPSEWRDRPRRICWPEDPITVKRRAYAAGLGWAWELDRATASTPASPPLRRPRR
jgi:hypothetical protein